MLVLSNNAILCDVLTFTVTGLTMEPATITLLQTSPTMKRH